MRSFSGPKNNFEGVLKLFKGPVMSLGIPI